MVSPDNFIFLRHIQDSCRKIREFIKDLDYEKFTTDEKTVSAVLRELSVVGEAARKTTDNFRNSHPQISWEEIFGMRNKLVHDYTGVQLPVVWQTVQEDIPNLEKTVNEILKSEK